MKARTTFTARNLLATAIVALAPIGVAKAGQDCEGDPFGPYSKSFFADGQYECRPAAPRQDGAQGPAGPVMDEESGKPALDRTTGTERQRRGVGVGDDPWARVDRVFIGD